MITLEYNTVEKDLAAWGFSFDSAQLAMRNLAASIFSVTRLGDALTDAAVFPYRGKVIIRSGRTGSVVTWSGGQVDFIGYRMQHLVSTSGAAFGVRYSFADAWHFLETTPYQQFFSSRNVDGTVLTYKAVPELLLFTYLDGANILQQYNSGQQIAAVLQFVLDAFAAQSLAQPFIIGDTSGITLDLPSYQTRQVMCAAVIKKCLELSPDVNLVVDYTTDVATVPTPTLNFKARAQQEAAPITLALHNGTNHVSLDIVARDDLKPRAVVIWYKITGNDTGTDWVVYLFDKYGPNGQSHASDPQYGLDVLTQFIDLQGQQTTSVKCDIVTETVDATHGTDATRLTWWKLKCPKLANVRIKDTSLAIAAGTVTVKDQSGNTIALATYPRELKEGPLPSWTGKTVKEVTIKGFASYDIYATDAAPTGGGGGSAVAGLLTKKVVLEEIAVKIQITNATTTTYSILADSLPGETVPGLTAIVAGVGTFVNGLAKDIWTSLATVQYEGQDVRVEAEPTTLVGFGNVLNLSGGLAAWATMKAQLQSIVKSYGTGRTEVSFGPPQGNSAAQMFELMQYSRPRFVWYNPALRETGLYATGGAAVEAGGRTPAENTTAGVGGAAQMGVFAAA